MLEQESDQGKSADNATTAQAGLDAFEGWRERTYTGTLMLFALIYLSFFINRDLKGGGRYLSAAFGVESDFWLTVFLFTGLVLSVYLSIEVALRAYLYEVVIIYKEKPLGLFASGLYDICFWSSFLSYVITLYFFARFMTAGSLGGLRPFALLAAPIVPSCILAVIIVRRTLRALYGPSPRRSGGS